MISSALQFASRWRTTLLWLTATVATAGVLTVVKV